MEAPQRSELQGQKQRRRGIPESQHSDPPQPSLRQGQRVHSLPVWAHFLLRPMAAGGEMRVEGVDK